jgi:hypothetical protein
MKATRIAALALFATAAVGFNAMANDLRSYGADVQIQPSTLTRAQVQAEAAQASRITNERDSFVATPASSQLSREAVRAEAVKARVDVLMINNAS